MSHKLLNVINQKWSGLLQENGSDNFMVYEPFSAKYWTEPVKISMCNLEGFGYEDCGITKVDLETFKQWMKDTHITKTCRYASVFTNVLFETLNAQKRTTGEIKDSYYDYDKLVDAISRTSYMNFRKTSNSSVSQDSLQIMDEVVTYKTLIREFIFELEPDILLIGGKVGVLAFNTVFEPEQPLVFNQYTKINKTLVCSINHLSRPNYKYFSDKSQEIIYQYKSIFSVA